MARLDIRRLRGRGRQIVVELQSDYARDLPTIVVAPIIPVDDLSPYPGINPRVRVDGIACAVRLDHIVGVAATRLGDRLGSLLDREFEIDAAINRLLFFV